MALTRGGWGVGCLLEVLVLLLLVALGRRLVGFLLDLGIRLVTRLLLLVAHGHSGWTGGPPSSWLEVKAELEAGVMCVAGARLRRSKFNLFDNDLERKERWGLFTHSF